MTTTPELTEHRIATEVGELAVLDSGATGKPAIVFRHGIFLDRELWRPIALQFASTHRVVLVDAPGHGESGDPGRQYSLGEDARASIQIMNALGIEQAALIGHSWGGMSSLRAALAEPERVTALALVNTPLKPGTAAERARFAALQLLLRVIGAPRWYGRQIVPSLFDPSAHDSAIATRMVERLRVANRFMVARAMVAVLVRPDDVTGRFGELRMPVLAIAGEDDYVLKPAAAELLANAVPHARVVHVRGQHATPVEQPEALVAELTRLLGER